MCVWYMHRPAPSAISVARLIIGCGPGIPVISHSCGFMSLPMADLLIIPRIIFPIYRKEWLKLIPMVSMKMILYLFWDIPAGLTVIGLLITWHLNMIFDCRSLPIYTSGRFLYWRDLVPMIGIFPWSWLPELRVSPIEWKIIVVNSRGFAGSDWLTNVYVRSEKYRNISAVILTEKSVTAIFWKQLARSILKSANVMIMNLCWAILKPVRFYSKRPIPCMKWLMNCLKPISNGKKLIWIVIWTRQLKICLND